MIKKIFKLFVWLGVLATIAGFSFLIYIYNEIRFDVETVVEYEPSLTSKVYDKNGELIANIFKQHREYAQIEQIPGYVIEALVAIEDTKFYEHSGINVDAIIRAAITDIKAGAFVEGASTITQQLVKTKVLSRDKKIMRKIKEALLAMRLETLLSKDAILERYLNEVYFGHGYYGIKTAAKGYFKKELDGLSLKESAMLVGLPRAPSYYDPTKRYEESLKRANSVITRMRDLGWIDEQVYLRAIQESPQVYDQTLSQNKAPYIVDEVLRQEKIEDIKTGGYEIHTSIDLQVQELATQALRYGYEKILSRDINGSNLNGAMVVTQKGSDAILALVGGVDYEKSKFNRATQAMRQPGSSFKPFIYQAALDLGYSQATQLYDIARTYDFDEDKSGDEEEQKKWRPKNYGSSFGGVMSLKDALIHSRNLATINLVQSVGFKNISRQLAPLDVQLPQNLSIALGNLSTSPLQMAKFYSAFTNYGEIIEPNLVTKVYKNDKLIKVSEERRKQYTTTDQAFLMVDLLKEAVNSGTGRGVKVNNIELAGKTGTTNDNIDTWFCGFSPNLQVVVWYGRDDNTPIGKDETGGRTAGPAFKYFFQNYLQSHPQTDRKFTQPQGVYKGVFEGKEYLFTDTSKIPTKKDSFDDNLIF
ncbi:MAG: transglycosylase domain-containing protein [Campylobacterota bacterium]